MLKLLSIQINPYMSILIKPTKYNWFANIKINKFINSFKCLNCLLQSDTNGGKVSKLFVFLERENFLVLDYSLFVIHG